MQSQTMQSIFILLNNEREKCVLKTERKKPTVMSYEFEEKLQKATKPIKCQSMSLSRTTDRSFHPLYTCSKSSPQNHHSCLLPLRAVHSHSLQNFCHRNHMRNKNLLMVFMEKSSSYLNRKQMSKVWVHIYI